MCYSQQSSGWSTEAKRIDADKCGWVEPSSTSIQLSLSIHHRALALCQAYPNLEWLGYLLGYKKDAIYFATQMVIPPQEVTGASVNVTNSPADNLPNIIGTIHSHNSMGVFFSATDDKYIASNYPIVVVVNNAGLYKGGFKTTLPCGSVLLRDCPIGFSLPKPPDLTGFVVDAKTKITQKTYTPPSYPTYPYQYPYGAYGSDTPDICDSCGKQIYGGFVMIGERIFHHWCAPKPGDFKKPMPTLPVPVSTPTPP